MKKLWGLPWLSGVAALFLLAMSLAIPAASADSAGVRAHARTQAQIAAGETALYVDQSSSSCSNSGPGSQAIPFCSIQSAANVVDPGQTVYIETAPGTQAQDYDENVTITRSGTPSAPITFARLGTDPIPDVDPYTNGGIPITLRNVHDVRLYFLAVDHRNGQNGIEVIGSSDITLDRVYDIYDSPNTTASAGVTIDGGSSDVTISRSEISGVDGYGVQSQPGAQGVTVTTNEIVMQNGTGVALSDASGGAVTSNTVFQFCGAGVSVTGGSSAVAENNIIDMLGNSGCAPPGAALSVDQDSAGTVRADYNALYVKGPDTEYSWAGASYANAAAFNAATGQGAHDLDLTSAIKLTPPAGSPVIDSADCTAPSELSTDFPGNPRVRDPRVPGTGAGTCYADRGAFELQDSLNPAPSAITPASLQGPVPFGLSVTLSAPAKSGWGEPVSYTIDFGDGSGPVQVAPSSTTSHTYITPGQYTLTVTAADTGGSTQTYQRQVVAET